MARVTKDTMIGDLLQIDQNVAPLLLNRLLWFTDLTRMILSLKSTHSSITTSVNLRKDGLLMQAVFYLQSIFC